MLITDNNSLQISFMLKINECCSSLNWLARGKIFKQPFFWARQQTDKWYLISVWIDPQLQTILAHHSVGSIEEINYVVVFYVFFFFFCLRRNKLFRESSSKTGVRLLGRSNEYAGGVSDCCYHRTYCPLRRRKGPGQKKKGFTWINP
jgi:hypothetical protein